MEINVDEQERDAFHFGMYIEEKMKISSNVNTDVKLIDVLNIPGQAIVSGAVKMLRMRTIR